MICPIDMDLEDKDDENEKLVDFYKRNLPCLMRCPLENVGPDVIRIITVLIHATKLWDEDWRTYATKMGIRDNYTLTEIKVCAEQSGQFPIFLVMDVYLRQSCTPFGKIISALLSENRFDILKKIEPNVRDLLKPKSETETKRIECFSEESPRLLGTNTRLTFPLPMSKHVMGDSGFPLPSLSGNIPAKFKTVLKHMPPDEHRNYEHNAFQQSSVNIHPTNKQISTSFTDQPPAGMLNETNTQYIPAKRKLSVLVQHTESESNIAEELAIKLVNEGMIVSTLSDLNDLTPYDATNALNTLFQDVDFIVPVVSNSLLEQINPQNYDTYLESTYAQNNRSLYQLIMNEYRNNRCVNYRVRPVIVPEMSRRLLIRHVILSFSFRLWNELPKLVRILRETKVLNAEELVH